MFLAVQILMLDSLPLPARHSGLFHFLVGFVKGEPRMRPSAKE